MPNKIRVGLVGCGVIAERLYVPGIAKIPTADFVAVCDVVEGRARALAAQHGIPQVYTDFEEMLEQSGIELVVNLTQIPYHFEVNLQALRAGKHLFSEKPMTSSIEDATIIIEEARQRDLRVVACPVMMLSPVNQKIGQLLRDGAIGKVNYAISHNSHAGAANLLGMSWTTDPTWFYKPGAGPILDMGVYGLTTLTGLLGPARRVFAQAGISWPQRTVRTGPFKGKVIDVETADNILITLDFGDNVFAMLDSTFCVRATKSPPMEIYGADGTIVMNPYGSELPISVFRDFPEHDLYGWMDMKIMQEIKPFTLTAGIDHLIDAINDPTLQITPTAEHARHVIEIMNTAYEAAREGRSLELTTSF